MLHNPAISFSFEYMVNFYNKVVASITAMDKLMGLNNLNGVNKRYAFTLLKKQEEQENKKKSEKKIKEALVQIKQNLEIRGLPRKIYNNHHDEYVKAIDQYEQIREDLEHYLNQREKEETKKPKIKAKVSAKVLASLEAQEIKETPRKKSWREIADL